MSKTILKLIAASFIFPFVLAGCVADRYTSETTTYEIQVIGDSYFDHDGHVPKRLALRSSEETTNGQQVVYHDRSKTNSKLNPDIHVQMNEAIAAATDGNYQIKTLLVDGGANFFKSQCSPGLKPAEVAQPGSDATQEEIDAYNAYLQALADYDAKCESALTVVKDEARALLKKAVHADVENIVWGGYYYVGEDEWIEPEKMDLLVEALRTVCDDINNYCSDTDQCSTSYNDCTYVEMRGVWGPSEGNRGGDYLFDGLHVTQHAGCLVGDVLWQALVDNDIYRMPESEQGIYNPDVAASIVKCDDLPRTQ